MFHFVSAVLTLGLVGAYAPSKSVSTASAVALNAKSKSVPFAEQPPALTGKLPGDVGFDPLGLSSIWIEVTPILSLIFPFILVCFAERLE